MREGFTQQRCPKCGGNIFLYKELYGWSGQCLQCGHTSYLDAIVNARDNKNVSRLVQADETNV